MKYCVGSLKVGDGFEPCYLVKDEEHGVGYYMSDITDINDKRVALFKDLDTAINYCHSELEFIVSLENPKKVLYLGYESED
tara:strand:- start:616 stop:858 length:243 start_codon:yes stop_codon:yes gene_type:complete